jgi:hypothetical protein
MHIYVDFDDCLCETARAFSKLALEMFNKHVPYDRIHFFELDKSFDLDAEQYERFMFRGHEPEILLSFNATPGAAKTINERYRSLPAAHQVFMSHPVYGWTSMDFRTPDCTVSTNMEGIILSKTVIVRLNLKTFS